MQQTLLVHGALINKVLWTSSVENGSLPLAGSLQLECQGLGRSTRGRKTTDFVGRP